MASLKHRSCQHRQPFPLFGPPLPKEPRPHPNMAKTQTLRKLPSGLNLIYLGRRLCHTHTTTGPSGDNTSASKEWTQSMKDHQSEPTHRTSTQAPQEQSLQQETGRHRPAPLPYLRRSASTCWLSQGGRKQPEPKDGHRPGAGSDRDPRYRAASARLGSRCPTSPRGRSAGRSLCEPRPPRGLQGAARESQRGRGRCAPALLCARAGVETAAQVPTPMEPASPVMRGPRVWCWGKHVR